MKVLSVVRLFVFSLFAAVAFVAAAAQVEPDSSASFQPLVREMMRGPVARDDILEPRTTVHTFRSLVGTDRKLILTGLGPNLVIPFTVARDDIAVKSVLTLSWTASPSLIPVRSQLNIRVNGELQKSIALTSEMLGKKTTLDVEINPKDFKDQNELQFNFVGSYTEICGTPAHPTLWLQLHDDSALKISAQKIRVADELQLLPAPFVDKAIHSLITLPFVFAKNIDDLSLQAGAVVASWAGLNADWRGARFPVYFDEPPADSHFVTFVTADTRPTFLEEFPEINGPEIIIADAPFSSWAKMLIVAGRDRNELLIAARALALQSDTLSGSRSIVRTPPNAARREAYDAPKWIRTDRKVNFSELITYKQQLRSGGALPSPVRVNFSLPPDLYVLPRTNIPLELSYRYTPPADDSTASLRILINDSIMETRPLERSSGGLEKNVRRIPALDSMASWIRALNIPAVYLDASNQLTFDFQYSLVLPSGNVAGNCVSVILPENHIEILPTSTLDFRGFYHFAELPNTRLFTQSGYPFSRYADLSQTVVVLDEHPAAQEISTMLTSIGRIAAQTGAPATYVTVSTTQERSLLTDKDILIVSRLPVDSDPGRYETLFAEHIFSRLLPDEKATDQQKRHVLVDALNYTSDKQAAIVGFESPLTKLRSVVALLALPGEGSRALTSKLAVPGSMSDAEGALSYVTGDTSVNFYSSQPYYISDLPWYQTLWFYLLNRPGVLLLCVLMALTFAIIAITVVMKRLIAKRMRDQQKALTSPKSSR